MPVAVTPKLTLHPIPEVIDTGCAVIEMEELTVIVLVQVIVVAP